MRTFPAWVSAMMGIALLLAIAMSFESAINTDATKWRGPPDEHSHRTAARFYLDHWLPPRAGDPATLDSYSRDYGFSYLNELDLVYPIAGKFAALVSPMIHDPDRGLRLFNLTLFALLTLVCVRRPGAWPVFVPLVMTPQAWYIFSYFNGDAFPLFLSVLIAYQVAYPASRFNRYLESPGFIRGLSGALLLAALVAMLLLSKRNYFTFLTLLPALLILRRLGLTSAILLAAAGVASAAAFLGWVHVNEGQRIPMAAAALAAVVLAAIAPRDTRRERSRALAKFAVLGLAAVMLAIPRVAWDELANPSPEERQATLGKLQEQIAKPGYKPSEIYSAKPNPDAVFAGIDMRARGVPLQALFQPPWNWHVRTFSSFAGQYGWLDILAPLPYYIAIAIGYALAVAAYLQALVRARSELAWGSFGVAVACWVLTIALSLHHSWNNDFQAQGRYLFPALAMAGAGLVASRSQLTTRFFAVAVVACFLLSAWSFTWVGLRQIPSAF